MKKILKRNKGFTLVECIVAIAIFALMSALVMQILALSIRQYRKNHHTETDIDKQIENIVGENAVLTERETMDIAINFVLNGGNTVVSGIKVEDVSVKKDPNKENVSDRLELNTFEATIQQDPNDKNKEENGSMITEDIHIYGSKGIEEITVKDETTVDGDNYKVKLSFQVFDKKNVLDSLASNAIKIAIPDSAKFVKLTNNDDNKSTYLKLSSTNYRIFDNKLKDSKSDVNTTYDFSISFEMDKDKYEAEYGNFAKYFISPDSKDTTNTATFNDAVTPGIYNSVKKAA